MKKGLVQGLFQTCFSNILLFLLCITFSKNCLSFVLKNHLYSMTHMRFHTTNYPSAENIHSYTL